MTLQRRDWLNPNQSIYKDPNGPDKCVNRTIMTVRANYFQALNRYKRRILFNTLSYDTLKDIYDEIDFIFANVSSNSFIGVKDDYNDDIIKKFFDKKDYLKAFMIDILSYNNDINTDIAKEIHQLDSIYASYFADKYNYSVDLVQKAINYETALSKKVLENKIEQNKLEIKKYLKEINRG